MTKKSQIVFPVLANYISKFEKIRVYFFFFSKFTKNFLNSSRVQGHIIGQIKCTLFFLYDQIKKKKKFPFGIALFCTYTFKDVFEKLQGRSNKSTCILLNVCEKKERGLRYNNIILV